MSLKILRICLKTILIRPKAISIRPKTIQLFYRMKRSLFRAFPDYLNQPLGMETTRRGRVVIVAVLLVLFVLGVFQPFGIAGVESSRKIVIVGLSAAGTLTGLVGVLYLLPRLFPRYYASERWTVGKNILNQLGIVLAIGGCVGGFLVAWTAWNLGHLPAHAFRMFGQLLLAVGIVSPIPLAVTAMMVRNQHLQRHLEEMNRYLSLSSGSLARPVSPLPAMPSASSTSFTSSVTSAPSVSSAPPESLTPSAPLAPETKSSFSPGATADPAAFSDSATLLDSAAFSHPAERSVSLSASDPLSASGPSVLLAGSTKERLLLPAETLLYLEACGNYVKIFYEAEGKPKQKLLRATIKQMEDALQPYPFILRCHRAFLVNTGQVVRVRGNSQGYRLQFRQTEEEVPVSRAYTGRIRERFR